VSGQIAENLAFVKKRILAAAEKAGRNADEIKLIAVSKSHPAASLCEAMAAGEACFGENKMQEAESKIAEIGREAAEWHLIGHLQSNKARKAVQLIDVVHSLDSVELAARLERICIEEGRETLPVLIQVDLAGEESKSGIEATQLSRLSDFLSGCERLRLKGLMALPPFFDDPEAARPFFVRLRELRDRLASEKAFANGGGELSMGMSHDLEVAIEEGSTMVRVGTAIFGKREYGMRA